MNRLLKLDSKVAVALIVPVLVAAVVFGVSVSMYPNLPVLGDPVVYHMTAQRLLEQGVYAHLPNDPSEYARPDAGVTPGYAVFLSGIYALTGARSADATASVISVQPKVAATQFLLMLAVVALVAACGLILGRRRLALWAGLMAALYVPFAWMSSVALGESLATFLAALLLLIVLLSVRKDAPNRHRLLFFYGLVGAALVLVRPAFILWLPFPLLFLAWRRIVPARDWPKVLAVTAVGFMLLMGPWWIRNAVVMHRFVPLADNSGRVRYFSTGGGELTQAEQRIYDAAEARNQDGWNAVASSRKKTAWRTAPATVVRSKYSATVGAIAYPWPATYDVYWALSYSPNVLKISRGDFNPQPSGLLMLWGQVSKHYHRLLMLLAAFAIGLIPRSPRLGLLASLPLYAIAVHSATMFLPRYFIPVMPTVILLAAVSGCWVTQQLRKVVSGTQ